MEIVNEITKGDFVLVEFRFQLQGIYEVLDIVATAINNLQKNGVPYHMLFWEKERVNTMIANVNCLCYLSPHHSAEEIISNIQDCINEKYSHHIDEDIMSFCCIVNYRTNDGIITNDMEFKAEKYFRRCYPQDGIEMWKDIIRVLKLPEVKQYYGISSPCSFWKWFFSLRQHFMYIQDEQVVQDLENYFSDYSTLPSSSAFVERCFSIEKRIRKMKSNISDQKVEASLQFDSVKRLCT